MILVPNEETTQMATTDLATAATDKVQAFIDKLADAGGKIVDAATPALHTAAEAAFTAVVVGGVVAVARSVVLLIIAGLVVKYGVRLLISKAQAAPRASYGGMGDAAFAFYIGAALTSIGVFILSLTALIDLLSASTWLAIFRPDAAIAAKVLGL